MSAGDRTLSRNDNGYPTYDALPEKEQVWHDSKYVYVQRGTSLSDGVSIIPREKPGYSAGLGPPPANDKPLPPLPVEPPPPVEPPVEPPPVSTTRYFYLWFSASQRKVPYFCTPATGSIPAPPGSDLSKWKGAPTYPSESYPGC
jgi:hypothetical protein